MQKLDVFYHLLFFSVPPGYPNRILISCFHLERTSKNNLFPVLACAERQIKRTKTQIKETLDGIKWGHNTVGWEKHWTMHPHTIASGNRFGNNGAGDLHVCSETTLNP